MTFLNYRNTALTGNARKVGEAGMNEWISVNDKLPELNQRVLVYAIGKIDGFIGEHTIEICERFIQRIFPSSPGHEMWSSPYQYFHTDYKITHWMLLPEPPPKRKTAHWVFGNTMGHSWMKCSECCVSQSGQTGCWTYCPNCGADMRILSANYKNTVTIGEDEDG